MNTSTLAPSLRPCRVLAIDDDPLVHIVLDDYCRTHDLSLRAAGTGRAALDLFAAEKADLVLLDLMLPDLPGVEVLRRLRALDGTVPVVVISAQQQSDLAIEAMKQGGFDYLTKPLDLEHLHRCVSQALETRRKMAVAVAVGVPEQGDLGPREGLVGMSPAMQRVYKAIARVAAHDVSVLIQGETGTGKELVARAIYQHSPRAGRPFLAINCAAIPETLLESELFGHERGAFTGAERQRIGKFEQTSGGTILLDEIGDLPLSLQAKLLRVLEERRFQRLGGNETIDTDVRILAATHRRLDEAVAAGQFRADLYYRLNVYTIALPPLRERLEDLPALASHAFKWLAEHQGGPVFNPAPESLLVLQEHDWPGNVRELLNALRHAALHARSSLVTPEDLPDSVRRRRGPSHDVTKAGWPDAAFVDARLAAGSMALLAEVTQLVEQNLLQQVMVYSDWNLTHAAARLGITRGHLRKKLRQFNLLPPGNQPTPAAD